jgi:phage shock protein PspC (stress-responsive transcriptional regulator)
VPIAIRTSFVLYRFYGILTLTSTVLYIIPSVVLDEAQGTFTYVLLHMESSKGTTLF